jgi:biofilm protein TabA
MIIDHIKNTSVYTNLNQYFAKAFDYIENLDTSKLQEGRNEIDGENIFVMYVDGANRAREAALLEAHKDYLDLHYTVAGSESLGWLATQECQKIDQPYDKANDVALYQDEPKLFVDILPEHFCIVWPSDAHMPMVGQGLIKKLVFKIKI